MKSLKTILILLAISLSSLTLAGDIEDQKLELQSLDRNVAKKWELLKEWQQNPEWIKGQSDLAVAGMVYSKGWFGPKVSRQIVPDMQEGFLAVDTITVGPDLLLQGAVIAGNILFHQLTSFAPQVGVIKEKSFVNIRHYNSYREALVAPNFKLSKLPLENADFSNLEEGEQISTVTVGGFFTRLGGGIMNLIGLELPANLNFGPKFKYTVKDSLKLTVAKETDQKVVISVERAKDIGAGFGIGFGIFFDDVIDVPVSVGINQQNGYSPIIFNYKKNKKKTKAVMFTLDLKTDEGKEAYRAFLNRDFSVIDDLAKEKNPSVKLDMIKEGDIKSREINAAINLIFWRSGFRNIFVEAKYNTTTGNGKKFEYVELDQEDIKDSKSWGEYEKVVKKFSVLVPVKSNDDKHAEVIAQRSFILDTLYHYSDSEAIGNEIDSINKELLKMGSPMALPIRVNGERNYEAVNINVKVRFSSEAISEMMNASDEDLWISLGYASGLADPYEWENAETRNDYLHNGNGEQEEGRSELLKRAKKVRAWLKTIREESTATSSAKKLLKYLRSGDQGRLLHKTILELAGIDKVMIRGYIKGKHF